MGCHVACAWNLGTRLSTKYNTPDPLVAARILGKVGGQAPVDGTQPAATEHGANAAKVELSQAAACPP